MVAVAMLSTACSVPAAEGPASPGTNPPEAYPEAGVTPGRECRDSGFARFVGREGTQALATEARDAAGAAVVRWLRPGQVVTMEYRRDRLNIEIDARGRVRALRCG